MSVILSLPRLSAGIALLALVTGPMSRVHADDGEASADSPPVPSPQTAAAGEEMTRAGLGRIIIVEPDGTRREFNLSTPGSADRRLKFDFFVPHPATGWWIGADGDNAPRVLRSLIDEPRVVIGDYMIGLDCVPADAALRIQLGLGEKGLLVRSPLEESPAAEAGILSFDVLIKAGDKDLVSVQDLMDAVQAADGKPLTITLIRGGQEQTVEVRPVKRMDVTMPPPGPNAADLLRQGIELRNFPPGGPLHTLRMHAVRPGVVIEDRVEAAGSEKLKEIESRIQTLTDQVQALQKSIDELKQK